MINLIYGAQNYFERPKSFMDGVNNEKEKEESIKKSSIF